MLLVYCHRENLFGLVPKNQIVKYKVLIKKASKPSQAKLFIGERRIRSRTDCLPIKSTLYLVQKLHSYSQDKKLNNQRYWFLPTGEFVWYLIILRLDLIKRASKYFGAKNLI